MLYPLPREAVIISSLVSPVIISTYSPLQYNLFSSAHFLNEVVFDESAILIDKDFVFGLELSFIYTFQRKKYFFQFDWLSYFPALAGIFRRRRKKEDENFQDSVFRTEV